MQTYLENEETFRESIKQIFVDAHKEEVYEHTLEVVEEARLLAKRFQVEDLPCLIGAYLHDIGRTLKLEEYLDVCELEGIEVLEVERNHPRILHGKISRQIALTVYDLHAEDLLDAIQYHTTLRPQATLLDKIVFLADKLSWKDLQYEALIGQMRTALDQSIDHAIWLYVADLHTRSAQLKLYHPNAQATYEEYALQFLNTRVE